MATKLGKLVTYPEGLLPITSHNPLITRFCEITWRTKNFVSIATISMATKFGKVVMYLKSFLSLQQHGPLGT